jgi:hypothetical protein
MNKNNEKEMNHAFNLRIWKVSFPQMGKRN